MFLHQYIQVLFLSFFFCSISLAQQSKDEDVKINPCNQSIQNTKLIIKDAEKGVYRIQRIEIWGNIYIRDRDLRKEILLKEGDIFARKSLNETIKRLSRMKKLEPMSLKNVKMILDFGNKDIYMIICVKEKEK